MLPFFTMCIKGLGLQWMVVTQTNGLEHKMRRNKVTATCTTERSSCLKNVQFPPDTVWHSEILTIMYSILFLKIYLPAEFDSRSASTFTLMRYSNICSVQSFVIELCAWDLQSKICFVKFKYLQTTLVCSTLCFVTSEVAAGQVCALRCDMED